MDAAPYMGAVKIALRPIKVGERHFEPGDRYDPEELKLTERQTLVLERQKFIGPFSPETYRIAIARRPPGTVGKGFSLEFLYQTGALERPPAGQHPASAFVPGEMDEPHLGYFLHKRPSGIATMVTVLAANGHRLAEKEFRSVGKAKEFVETLPAADVAVTDDSYDALLLEVESLMGAEPGTAAGRRLVALAAAIEAYEKAILESTDSHGSANQEQDLESEHGGDLRSGTG